MKKLPKNRKGIALLIVLGMLSLLMIMVVAYTTLMRQQFAGTANYRHQSSARNMLHVALARALNDINDKVGEDKVPNWPDGREIANLPDRNRFDSSVSTRILAPEDILFSVDVNNDERAPFAAFVMRADMTNHVTVPFMRRITQNDAVLAPVYQVGSMERCTPEWAPIKDTKCRIPNCKENPTAQQDHKCPASLLGRYCYVILNTSSLLDATTTGGLEGSTVKKRMFGTSPSEIQLLGEKYGERILPELTDPTEGSGSKAINFLKARALAVPMDTQGNFLGRLDSLRELINIANAKNKPKTMYDEFLSSFRTSSRSLPEILPETGDANKLGATLINNGKKIRIGSLDTTRNYSFIQNNKKLIIDVFEKTIPTPGLIAHYKLGTASNPNRILAERVYNTLCDMVGPSSEWSKPPAGDTPEMKYQRPTVKPIPLPVNFGTLMLLTKEDVMVANPANPPVPAQIPKVRLYARYQMFGHLASFWRDQNNEIVVPTEKIARFRFKGGLNSINPAFNKLTLSSACGMIDRIVTEKTHGGSAQGYFFNPIQGKPGKWSDPVFLDFDPGSPNLENIEIKQTISFQIDILNSESDNEALAQRPAVTSGGSTEDDRYIRFTFKAKFDLDGIPLENVVGSNLPDADAASVRKCWVETLDPRSAWRDTHWLPYDEEDTTIPTLQLLATNCGVEIPNNAFDALTWLGWGWAARQFLQSDGTHLTKTFLNNNRLQLQVDGHYKGENGGGIDSLSTSTWRWYIRNDTKGGLKNVGELGFLPLAPFFTITLYDPQNNPFGWLPEFSETRKWSTKTSQKPTFHRVLDYFTMEDENQATRGKVNLCTSYRIYDADKKIIAAPALAAVFAGMPLNGAASRVLIGPSTARDAMGNIQFQNCSDLGAKLAEIQADLQTKNDTFKYTSDLASMFEGASTLNNAPDSQGTPGKTSIAYLVGTALSGNPNSPNWTFGEWEREALIANSANLFTLRDQTFTILLRADAFTSGFGMQDIQKGSTLGTAHAIVEVWRDPEPLKVNNVVQKDSAGKNIHPMRILNFKILE